MSLNGVIFQTFFKKKKNRLKKKEKKKRTAPCEKRRQRCIEEGPSGFTRDFFVWMTRLDHSADHCVEAGSESIFRSWARLLEVAIG